MISHIIGDNSVYFAQRFQALRPRLISKNMTCADVAKKIYSKCFTNMSKIKKKSVKTFYDEPTLDISWDR